MKNFIILGSFILVVFFGYSQERAEQGTYSIEIKSIKQAKIELSDEILIEIESVRQDETDKTIKIDGYSVLVMSREKLEQEIVWPKYKISQHK